MGLFGDYIKSLRKAKNLTQVELGQQIGVSHTYVSKLETGNLTVVPSEKVIKQMSSVLNAPPDLLLLLTRRLPKDLNDLIFKDELALGFLQALPSFSEEQRKQIQMIIEPNEDWE